MHAPARLSVQIPPPLPLYSFPQSKSPNQPPLTGFSHSLPVVRHLNRTAVDRPLLREPLQDPRRGMALAQWFRSREREEASRCKQANGSTMTQRLVYDNSDPTGSLLDRRTDDIEFDSWFESGNLRAAWRIEGRCQATQPGSPFRPGEPSYVDQEYDLLCSKDTHTNGNIQWFYFSVYRPPGATTGTALRVRLNIVNMMKKSSLYSLGMLPVAYCDSAKHNYGWTRVGEDVCYYRNSRTYSARQPSSSDVSTYEERFKAPTLSLVAETGSGSRGVRHHYTLSFAVALPEFGTGGTAAEKAKQRVFLAHCYPYTYSDLRHELHALDKRVGPNVLRRRRLCTTLAGNECDVLTVTNFATRDPEVLRKRAGVVLTARVHPGESNSSFMMRGCVEFLTSDDDSARKLRDHFVFRIVPMLNPDGVINGNYRTSLAGEDLNRRYATPTASLQPTVHAIKQLLRTTHESRGVLLYVDMHGHSRKKNIFFYGCSDAKMAPSPPSSHLSAVLNKKEHEGLDQEALREAFFTSDHRVMARVLPRMASNLNGEVGDAKYGDYQHEHAGAPRPAGGSGGSLFSFRDSSFSVQHSKRETGRVVAWRELGIANSFTLEASFCSPGLNEEQDLLAAAERELEDAKSGSASGDGLECETTGIPLDLAVEPEESLLRSGRADACAPPLTAEQEDLSQRPHSTESTCLKAKCVESWEREMHYTVEDLELAGKQLCIALYHYAGLGKVSASEQEAHPVRARNSRSWRSSFDGMLRCGGARCGELVIPKRFVDNSRPLLDYGVYHVDTAMRASSELRPRAELELRAVLRAKAAAGTSGPSMTEYMHEPLDSPAPAPVPALDDFLPLDFDPGAESDSSACSRGKPEPAETRPDKSSRPLKKRPPPAPRRVSSVRKLTIDPTKKTVKPVRAPPPPNTKVGNTALSDDSEGSDSDPSADNDDDATRELELAVCPLEHTFSNDEPKHQQPKRQRRKKFELSPKSRSKQLAARAARTKRRRQRSLHFVPQNNNNINKSPYKTRGEKSRNCNGPIVKELPPLSAVAKGWVAKPTDDVEGVSNEVGDDDDNDDGQNEENDEDVDENFAVVGHEGLTPRHEIITDFAIDGEAKTVLERRRVSTAPSPSADSLANPRALAALLLDRAKRYSSPRTNFLTRPEFVFSPDASVATAALNRRLPPKLVPSRPANAGANDTAEASRHSRVKVNGLTIFQLKPTNLKPLLTDPQRLSERRHLPRIV